MKLAVIGSAGQVGQEFSKLVDADQLVLLTRDQVDITDSASVEACVEKTDAEVIVNLAAFHDVNGCEDDAQKAFQVNALGAYHVATAAAKHGRKVVFFSSDYVFGQDASRDKPYFENDPVGPLSVYGASKVSGEQLVAVAAADHLVIRASSLFGVTTSKKGWTFPEMIMQRAQSGQPLKVVNDQYMSPTYTKDLVSTVLSLIKANATGIVHVSNADGCTWYDFAKETLKLAGIDYEIEPCGSDAFPSKASRPCYSRLDSERLAKFDVPEPRHWREGLQAYLVEKGVI